MTPVFDSFCARCSCLRKRGVVDRPVGRLPYGKAITSQAPEATVRAAGGWHTRLCPSVVTALAIGAAFLGCMQEAGSARVIAWSFVLSGLAFPALPMARGRDIAVLSHERAVRQLGGLHGKCLGALSSLVGAVALVSGGRLM